MGKRKKGKPQKLTRRPHDPNMVWNEGTPSLFFGTTITSTTDGMDQKHPQ
jgi:hypothetical protein